MMTMMMIVKWAKTLYLIKRCPMSKDLCEAWWSWMTLDDIDACKRNQKLSFNLFRAKSCKTDLWMICLLLCRELAPIAEYQANWRHPNFEVQTASGHQRMVNIVYRHTHTQLDTYNICIWWYLVVTCIRCIPIYIDGCDQNCRFLNSFRGSNPRGI